MAKKQLSNIKVIWTKRPARLVQKGETVSEVEWLDTGSRQGIPNDQIEFREGEKGN